MRSARTWIVLALTTAALVGIGIDLWGPRRSSLRDFDPNGVAKLETEMWRSYYDRREGRLFQEMAQLLRTQYHLPLLRSYVVAYQAARGAFVSTSCTPGSAAIRAASDCGARFADANTSAKCWRS